MLTFSGDIFNFLRLIPIYYHNHKLDSRSNQTMCVCEKTIKVSWLDVGCKFAEKPLHSLIFYLTYFTRFKVQIHLYTHQLFKKNQFITSKLIIVI